ncbi:hypothetical protein ThidrDRAFT_0371 [Thiorhodococcus drewsii AZ1]|uniref:Uncharacterized protein n=1 Tax=Thiorhodococcus drewsii AZ1 TaxID=765913 RepID=G2DWI2_9GAMM|nr:hypothetical protein ThidrDRAFT_0371 [Thiorhodococcus drewsii AZ1]
MLLCRIASVLRPREGRIAPVSYCIHTLAILPKALDVELRPGFNLKKRRQIQ